MIRIVCPFCHAPLSTQELETATIDGHASLVCPECENVLVTESALQNSSKRPSQPEILMTRSESRMIAVDERHHRL